nr:non-structural protein 1 [Rotavirus A]
MSVYRDAVYWYSKHIRVKNHRLLDNITRFMWRHADINLKIDNSRFYNIMSNSNNANLNKETLVKVVSHCLVCCKLSTLHACRVCNIVHTCAECLHTADCFLQNKVTQLRLRTLKYKLSECQSINDTKIRVIDLLKLPKKDHIKNIIAFYRDTFPIDEKVLAISRNKVRQRKCRNEYGIWASHLYMPICLLAKTIVLRDEIYLVFGVYERGKEINAPYQECNFYKSEYLIDEENFDRISVLEDDYMRARYACNAIKLTRKINVDFLDCSMLKTPAAYALPRYNAVLNVLYTVSLRSSDRMSIQLHSEWNSLYPAYRHLIEEKTAAAKARKRELLQYKSAIVLKYIDSPMYATLLWDKIMSTSNLSTLFCTHWFVDPLESDDPMCIYTKGNKKRAVVVCPTVHNMLYELYSVMKSAFSVGIYSMNGRYSCNEISCERLSELRTRLLAKNIIHYGTDFKTFIVAKTILVSDYSSFVYEAIRELDMQPLPITNMYSYRRQMVIVDTKQRISDLIKNLASRIIKYMLCGEFCEAQSTNLYTKTDRYVLRALDNIENTDDGATSDVD